MQNYQQQHNNWRVLWRLLRQNLPIVVFLVLATGGMLGIYWYFSPAFGNTEVVAAATSEEVVSAPVDVNGEPLPVSQRFEQSPAPIRIGIIAGHLESDSGAVCDDGLTELEVNVNIAEKVSANLTAWGVRNEILAEFDERLTDYEATALVSLHADSCVYFNELATGFKIASGRAEDSGRLEACMQEAYQVNTQMSYNTNTITEHMTDYHVFRKIADTTPAIIVETGFMNLDREILTTGADLPAAGITSGILCFLGKGTS